MSMKIVFATGNKGKLREAQEILGPSYEVVSPASLGITDDVPETGETLAENSLQKAMYFYEKTGLDCFADDTGLEVEDLGGAPGIYAARYAGPGCNFDDNMDKLLRELDKVEKKEGRKLARRARFRCVVTLLLDGKPIYFNGEMPGKIAEKKSGCRGFGYDPVFLPDRFPDKSLAELPEGGKNEISHRGMALRAMADYLSELSSHK